MPDYPRIFQPTTKTFFWTMLKSEILQRRFNKTAVWNIPFRNWLFRKLVGSMDGPPFHICVPIHFQQGNNLHIGKNFYCGPGFTVLDHAKVTIGDNVMIAPHVSLLTAYHPKHYTQRIVRKMPDTFEPHGRGEYELISPITIGNNVWIGSGAIVLPGVSIGDNSIIGAGSVVTRSVPTDSLAIGSPAKVVRTITEDDLLPENMWEDFVPLMKTKNQNK